MNGVQLDLLASRSARDYGMADSAAANSEWIKDRLEDLRAWLADKTEFKMEFFRAWCDLNNRALQSNHHAWGPLARAAV